MDKFFVSRIAGTPRRYGIFSNTVKGWKRHASFATRDQAEGNCQNWNDMENETDSRVLQAMGYC